MGAIRLAGVLLAAAAALGGCGVFAGSVPAAGFQGSGSCSMMPGGACQEQMDRAAARHPGSTSVEVACTVATCDRKRGAGTVVVTLASGATIKETFAYTGDPAPIPAPACAGMALDVCRSLATSTVDGLPPSKSIRAISIVCTASSCTSDRGEADVRVRFADGSEFQTNSGWEGAGP
jgi:hypothetical protein